DWTYLIHTYIFSSFLGMSLCYVIDRQHRENYLQNCIIETTQKEISDQAQLLEELSLLDPLTGLANRRYLNRILEAEWTLAIKQQEPISIIMLDIDYFKNYNDNLGHISGDNCLQSIAVALKSITNNHSEIAARYGGEEFLLVFPQTSTEKAAEIASLILHNIKNLEIKHPDSPICTNITVSLGVVTTIPNPDDLLRDFIEEADKKLYEAKNLGRNRYQIESLNRIVI
ncbi:GGDEF domain-containing protein, partial [Acinetobacter faecalis]